MKLLAWEKDGGGDSTVHGLYLIEIKSMFSIVLLRFSNGSRSAYHTHAFDAFSWVLKGLLREYHMDRDPRTGVRRNNYLKPSFKSFPTWRDTYHRVYSYGTTWALTFRGPWVPNWREYLEDEGRERTLASGRVEVVDIDPNR